MTDTTKSTHPRHVMFSVLADETTVSTQLLTDGSAFITTLGTTNEEYAGKLIKRTNCRDTAILNHSVLYQAYERFLEVQG